MTLFKARGQIMPTTLLIPRSGLLVAVKNASFIF